MTRDTKLFIQYSKTCHLRTPLLSVKCGLSMQSGIKKKCKYYILNCICLYCLSNIILLYPPNGYTNDRQYRIWATREMTRDTKLFIQYSKTCHLRTPLLSVKCGLLRICRVELKKNVNTIYLIAFVYIVCLI
jgi:hypothetical protein